MFLISSQGQSGPRGPRGSLLHLIGGEEGAAGDRAGEDLVRVATLLTIRTGAEAPEAPVSGSEPLVTKVKFTWM